MILCRHRVDEIHDTFGYGYILVDFGYKVRIRWINPKTKWSEHVLHKNAIYIISSEGELIKGE